MFVIFLRDTLITYKVDSTPTYVKMNEIGKVLAENAAVRVTTLV